MRVPSRTFGYDGDGNDNDGSDNDDDDDDDGRGDRSSRIFFSSCCITLSQPDEWRTFQAPRRKNFFPVRSKKLSYLVLLEVLHNLGGEAQHSSCVIF